jgi:AcrR family transcriptional regulator
MSMRALPGRDSRVTGAAPPAAVTRSSAHRDQRRRILRAIAELVAERGYAEVTVELIVKRARVSYKTFYKHFSGKEECFNVLFDVSIELTEKTIRARLAAEGGGWSERVVVALRTLVELIVAEPFVARAVIVEAPAVGPGLLERATEAFVSLLRGGRELSPRGSELPDRVEEALVGAVVWAAYERLLVGEVDELASHLPVLTELILRTYLGSAEASRIGRAVDPAPQPALA